MKDIRKYTDRSQYLKEAVSKRRKKIRDMAIEYKGDKCFICGYSRCKNALEFHHTDPAMKEFGLSKSGLTRSWERVKNEIEKCILVCANCHRELHDKNAALSRNTKVKIR